MTSQINGVKTLLKMKDLLIISQISNVRYQTCTWGCCL